MDDANRVITPDIHDMDDDSDAYTLAAALVYLRLPNIAPYPPIPGAGTRTFYRDKVVSICSTVAAQGVPTDVDARSRNPLGYILAADMINLGTADPIVDASFRAWIVSWLPQVRTTHDNRPNNQGLFAGGTRVAADIALGDAASVADETVAWDVFSRWLGEDQSPYLLSQWGGPERFTAWQAESFPFFRGINRMGMQALDCTGALRNVDGVLPDDQRRADCSGCMWDCTAPPAPGCPPPIGTGTCKFTWHTTTGVLVGPAKTNYAYTALQGALGQAVIHYRRGKDPWTIPDATFALKRAFVWLRDEAHQPVNDPINGDCDLWQASIANRLYPGLNLYEDLNTATEPGFQVGYSDWTTQCSTWP
jgi:hypothetical protein